MTSIQGTQEVPGSKPSNVIFFKFNLSSNRFQPQHHSSQVLPVFFEMDFPPESQNRFLSGRPDVRTPARFFLAPPSFSLCHFFFHFLVHFGFWVTSSNVSLEVHGLTEGARVRARRHVIHLPPHPARFFRGGKFPNFWPDS